MRNRSLADVLTSLSPRTILYNLYEQVVKVQKGTTNTSM